MRPRTRTPLTPPKGTLAVGVTVLALLILGCPDNTIKLSAVLPLTGVDAVYGESVKKGVELAYEELKAESSSILVEIVDSQSKPEVAKEEVENQYSSGAMAVIGGVTSEEVQAMIDVVDRFDRVLLSPSASSPELTAISENFYRIFPSDYSAATKMADFAHRMINVETVVVLVERAYGQGIQSIFEKAFAGAGGRVIEAIELPSGTSDFGGIVERVTTLEPDAVYLAAFAGATSRMIRELRGQEYPGRILTTSAFTTSAIADVGDAAKDVVLTQIFFELDSEHSHVKKFVEGFEQKYGEKPDLYAAHGYDALMVLATAVAGRPALASEVHKGLRDSISEFPGVTGSIQFNEKGDVQKYPRVYIVGEDLGLYDYNERIERQKEEIKRRKEELRKKLEDLHNKASTGD